jgi:hypothetical protein
MGLAEIKLLDGFLEEPDMVARETAKPKSFHRRKEEKPLA